ncbi:hypothetical protein HY948_02730, partial [Candidatus Gottesmanbacteria bacterium]|nr:hypothetical protein [Candidatus Gottesmanbacteria bacterium]
GRRCVSDWHVDFLGISVFLLGAVLFSRLTISYFDSSQTIVSPERIFYREHTARDFLTGVYRPSIQLLMGKFYYTPDGASYGSANALLFGTILSRVGPIFGQCLSDTPICFRWLYAFFVMASITMYLAFIWLISRDRVPEIRWAMYILYFAFLLGVTGSFGMERGNPDILWTSFVGIMTYAAIQSRERRDRESVRRLSLLVGVLAGVLTNAKIFLLPVTLSTIFIVFRRRVAVGVGIFAFLLVSYLPQAYGAKTTMWDLFTVTTAWVAGAARDFDQIQHLSYNHSAQALATWFVPCVASRTCISDASNANSIFFISWIYISGVFVLPFFSKDGKQWFVRLFHDARMLGEHQNIFLYSALAVAAVNLIPQSSFIYRLYYSFSLLLVMLAYVKKDSKSRMYLMFSLSTLTIKGLWVNLRLHPEGLRLDDVRVWNLLVFFHLYFFIRAGLAYTTEHIRGKRS